MNFLLDSHPLISFTIVSTVCVLFAIIGLKVVGKRLDEQYLKEHREVASIIFNAFGLIYAVLIAFVVFVTWSSYESSKKNLEMEVTKLSALFLDAGAFDDPMKKDIRTAVTEYTKTVIEQDWPVMTVGGRMPEKTREAHSNIWSTYTHVNAQKIKNPYVYEESLRQLNAMSEYTRLRWFSSRSSTPGVIWLVLIAGGILSVMYIFFFRTKQGTVQYFMTAAFTIMNSMALLLIYILDHPFRGYSAISNEPFRTVLRMFVGVLRQ